MHAAIVAHPLARPRHGSNPAGISRTPVEFHAATAESQKRMGIALRRPPGAALEPGLQGERHEGQFDCPCPRHADVRRRHCGDRRAPERQGSRPGNAIVLETAVPKGFGDWTELPDQPTQVVNPQTKELLDSLYSQILTRTYVHKDGYRIMLSMAYGDDQRGGLQAHRPEVCYPAQGFKVVSIADGPLATDFGAIEVRRLTTTLESARRAGDLLADRRRPGDQNKFDKRMAEIRLGLHRPDSRRAAVSGLVDRRRLGPGVRYAATVRGRHDVGGAGGNAAQAERPGPPARRRTRADHGAARRVPAARRGAAAARAAHRGRRSRPARPASAPCRRCRAGSPARPRRRGDR